MNDLISRQAAIDAVMETEPYIGTENIIYQRTDDVIANINKLPSVQPEIIRCKDCEYYELTEWAVHRCNLLRRAVYGNDFCAWAEPYKGEQE